MSDDRKRRQGRFQVPQELIDARPDLVLSALSGCLITRAEWLPHAGVVDYLAYGDHFSPVGASEPIPRYLLTISDTGYVTWERAHL